MFFPESEAIAREHPGLLKVIEQVDQQLSGIASAAALRTGDFACALGAEENQVRSVFDLLAQQGVLQDEKMVECERCHNLLPVGAIRQAKEDEDVVECTNCLRTISTRTKPIFVYRVAPKILNRRPAKKPHYLLSPNAPAQTTLDEPLGERARLVLEAMLDLDAIDSDRRRTTEEIAIQALGNGTDPNALKGVMSELKSRQLIDSKTGRGGGCWLKESGLARARKLRNSATV